jgi:hypothetical protein
MLLIEKKILKNGYVVFFGSNCYQQFDNFYKACGFAGKLENFVKFVEMSDGTEREVIKNKEKLMSLILMKMQFDEQEALGNIKINMKV